MRFSCREHNRTRCLFAAWIRQGFILEALDEGGGTGCSQCAHARAGRHRSGRKTLYLASHASHIIGWPAERGRELLDGLIEFSTQRRFVYQHHWQRGDLVMWDNRCTLHRARPYDDAGHRRDMRRTTVEES